MFSRRESESETESGSESDSNEERVPLTRDTTILFLRSCYNALQREKVRKRVSQHMPIDRDEVARREYAEFFKDLRSWLSFRTHKLIELYHQEEAPIKQPKRLYKAQHKAFVASIDTFVRAINAVVLSEEALITPYFDLFNGSKRRIEGGTLKEHIEETIKGIDDETLLQLYIKQYEPFEQAIHEAVAKHNSSFRATDISSAVLGYHEGLSGAKARSAKCRVRLEKLKEDSRDGRRLSRAHP